MNLSEQLGEWYPLLGHVFDEPWMIKLGKRIGAAKWVQPSLDNVFRAFRLCPPVNLKVVIISQDPYIKGEADGLAFSSKDKITPSLRSVFEEIDRTHACTRSCPNLDDWAQQGVLLLNSVLTTEMEKSRAHAGWGWELFTQEVIHAIRELDRRRYVFMLWGKDAQAVFNTFRPRGAFSFHPWKILKAHHPQAQNYNPSNKFVGCNHFVEANVHIMSSGEFPIWWPDPVWMTDESYIQLCENLQKQLPNASTHILEILRCGTTVPHRSRSVNPGLEPEHADDLPF